MKQNILKYRPVIIDLQNTHHHVLGIYIQRVSRGGGSLLPSSKTTKLLSLFLHVLTHEAQIRPASVLCINDKGGRLIVFIHYGCNSRHVPPTKKKDVFILKKQKLNITLRK